MKSSVCCLVFGSGLRSGGGVMERLDDKIKIMKPVMRKCSVELKESATLGDNSYVSLLAILFPLHNHLLHL